MILSPSSSHPVPPLLPEATTILVHLIFVFIARGIHVYDAMPLKEWSEGDRWEKYREGRGKAMERDGSGGLHVCLVLVGGPEPWSHCSCPAHCPLPHPPSTPPNCPPTQCPNFPTQLPPFLQNPNVYKYYAGSVVERGDC